MTDVGDLVLVYVQGAPVFFARVEEIAPDVKPQWYQVRLLVLQVPLVVITWVLRGPYIDGEEFFMGGRPVRLEKVVTPLEEEGLADHEEKSALHDEEREKVQNPADAAPLGEKDNVVSLLDRRRKKT